MFEQMPKMPNRSIKEWLEKSVIVVTFFSIYHGLFVDEKNRLSNYCYVPQT